MKIIGKVLLVMSILLNSVMLRTDALTTMSESQEKSLDNNSISFRYDNGWPGRKWRDFKFIDMGDGSARLKPTSNGNVINPNDIFNSDVLDSTVIIKFIDNEGSVYYHKQFNLGVRINVLARDLENVKIRYGLDKVQIISTRNAKGSKINGYIYSNLDNVDFSRGQNTDLLEMYQFRVEREGLYSEYINQVRIPDGEYIIETAENSNRVLDILDGYDIKTADYSSSKTTQKFRLEYDNSNKAYKIRTVDNKFIGGSTNVIATVGPYQDQFWYLQNADNGRHRLVNAKNIYKSLDLNRSNGNIEVHNSHSGLNQQFKFIKSEDKLNIANITNGEWKIASKINNNKVLNLDTRTARITIHDSNGANHQKWKFEYDSNKNAYRIKNNVNNHSMVWGSMNGNDVYGYAHANTSFSDQYWILEDVGDGYYIFKNYKNPNMVLDLYGSNANNGSNIQVHERKNTDNQKFKLIR